MNKKETIFEIISKLLDIEETSSKRVYFSYFGSPCSLHFHIAKNEKNYNEYLAPTEYVYFKEPLAHKPNELLKLYSEIEAIKDIPDGPVEEILTFKLTESRAKELGLIN